MNLVVKTHSPWRNRLVGLLVIAGLAAAGWTLFDYGRFIAGYHSEQTDRKIGALRDVQRELEKRIEDLREEKALLERAAQIERKAYNELDTTLKVLQGEILELKEELAFYRGIVSPKESSEGLQLQSFKLDRNGPSHSYRYKIVLTQVIKNKYPAYGKLRFRFDGLRKSESVSLELGDVTEKSVKELNYRFKYFQNIEGDVELPKDFSPLRVTIQVLPRGNQSEMIEKTIEWPFEETKTHVGKQEKAQTNSAN